MLLPSKWIHHSIKSPCSYDLPDRSGFNYSSQVEWSCFPAIEWHQITFSYCRIQHLNLVNQCHMDRSMSWYILIMHNISPHGSWKCDEESMQGRHYQGV